jgi:Carbohydrate-selective porin, OprB family
LSIILKCEVIALVASRFFFNIGKTSSILLVATFFVLGLSGSQAEAAANAGSDTTGVQETSFANKQLIARKPRKKVIKTKRRTVIKKKTTIVSPSGTTIIRESTVVTPTITEPAPPPPRVEDRPVQPQSQGESEAPVSQQDLDRLRGLVDSYRTELEGIDGRLRAVDAKAAKAGSGFSATTKLAGEVIIGVSGYGGASTDPAKASAGDKGNTLSDRVRLNFDTSFTGKDRLRTRLQAGNAISFNSNTGTPAGTTTGTNMTRFGFEGGSNNNTAVSLLQYSFPLNDSTKVIAETTGSEFNENMYTFNPLLAAAGTGSISRFGRFNPIYRQSGDGAGLTVSNKISDNIELSLGYAIPGQSTTAATPGLNSGLFNGSNAAIAQLAFRPSDGLSLGATYARSYSTSGAGIAGSTGSSGSVLRSTNMIAGVGADSPFGTSANASRTSANHYSLQASYKLGTAAVLSGWYGWTEATLETATGGSASTNNWAATLAFPDFGNKGNVLGFVVGQQPKLNTLTVGNTAGVVDSATSLHLEALYKMKLSDNVDITPGILFITNPENNAANATEYVGTIRTTFRF